MFSLITELLPLLMTIEKLVLAHLYFLGFAIIITFSWRWRTLMLAGGKAAKWIELLSKDMLASKPMQIELSEKDQATLAGRVVKTGMANLNLTPEVLEKVFEVQESAEKRELNRGIAFLGTVGSNAPFLGLTGTVIGILSAFDRFAASGGPGSTEVMVAISRALVATALGHLIAIPALVFYNILRSRAKSILEEAREVRGLIMARSLQVTFRKPEV